MLPAGFLSTLLTLQAGFFAKVFGLAPGLFAAAFPAGRPLLARCPLDLPSAQDFGDPNASGPPFGQTLGAVKEQKFEWNLAKEQAGAFF